MRKPQKIQWKSCVVSRYCCVGFCRESSMG